MSPHVLVLVGSLRASSWLRPGLADAAIAHLPAGVDGTVFARLADLPHYSEDLDHDDSLPRSPATCVKPSPTRMPCSWSPRLQRLAARSAQERRRLGVPPARCCRDRRQARCRHRRQRLPRGAQWAREDGVKVLKVAGASPLEDTVGVGSAFEPSTTAASSTPRLDGALRTLVADLVDAVQRTSDSDRPAA